MTGTGNRKLGLPSRISFPAARGYRLRWTDVPETMRNSIEARLGGSVTRVQVRRDGFSPAFAGIVTDSSGGKAFLKITGPDPNPSAPDFYRREIRSMSLLPPGLPVPRLLWTQDEGGWVALAFEPIAGRSPRLPWRTRDLERVFTAWKDLSERLTPAPSGFPSIAGWRDDQFRGWRSLLARSASPDDALVRRLDVWARGHLVELADLEAEWPGAAAGRSLLHGDLRADNILLTKDRVFFVDWPEARVGAPWVDVLCMLPSVAMQGGPQPWELWGRVAGTEDVPSGDARAMLAGIAGFFVENALKPPPPGLPTLREFQRVQGKQAIAWLRRMV
ncbi:MAG: phosphotransferase family protein [Thermoplasmata archaeon]